MPKNRGAQGAGAGSTGAAQGVSAGTGCPSGAQGAGVGSIGAAQGVGAGSIGAAQGVSAGSIGAAQGVGTGSTGEVQGVGTGSTGEVQGVGAGTGHAQGVQGLSAQLQNMVSDLAASTHGGSSGGSSGNPEAVRPGVTELVKLPAPTLKGALGFSDWLHAVKPSMSDLSDSSGECWDKVLQEACDWYNNQFVPANPINRVRLKIPASSIDRDPRWSRVRHRMEHLIIQSCPDAVKSELSAARISGVMGILCRLHVVHKPGGVAERAEALRQVQHPRPADSPIDAVLRLRTWKRWMTRLSDLGGAPPDAALSVQALEAIPATCQQRAEVYADFAIPDQSCACFSSLGHPTHVLEGRRVL